MSDRLLALAQDEVAKLQEELTGLQAEQKKLQHREIQVAEMLQAYRVIIKNRVSAGTDTTEEGPQESVNGSAGLVDHSKSPANLVEEEEQDGEGYGSKIGAVRKLFVESPRGFTPAELWQTISASKLTDRRGFVYTTIQKLHKRKEIERRRGGRYVATAKLLQPAQEESSEGFKITLQ